MNVRFSLLVGVMCLVLGLSTVCARAAEVGEFEIPRTMPLNDRQLLVLRNLVESSPGVAERVAAEAVPLLAVDPRPVEVIHYEGLVHTDPKRIACVEHLRDMTHAARLLRYWQATGDPRAADTLRRFVRAWAMTYEITGNDVNENKLYPLLMAYLALRDDFEAAERTAVDAFVDELGTRHLSAVRDSDHLTNRYAKHVRLLAICGMILERDAWLEEAVAGLKRFVDQSLRGDGRSADLELRDSLGYHMTALKPFVALAIVLDRPDLYDYTNDVGGSLRKSVDFVVPFALGEKTRAEWRNSKVPLDRQRAEAGLEKYQAGRLFEPVEALGVLEIAAFFDPALADVVEHLTDHENAQADGWQLLLNRTAAQARTD